MVEILNSSIVWWHWIIAGLLLIISEMVTGTFITLGFGISAIIVGVVEMVLPLDFLYQLTLWIVLSLVTLSILFRWFRGQQAIATSGQSDYGFDTLGSVIVDIYPQKRGKVLFDTPLLGNLEWYATSKEILLSGSRIEIVEVNGQLVEVKSIDIEGV